MFCTEIIIACHTPNRIWRIEIDSRNVECVHRASFSSAPRLRMSANSFWACSSNFLLRSIARLNPAISSSLVFSLKLIIYSTPFTWCKYSPLFPYRQEKKRKNTKRACSKWCFSLKDEKAVAAQFSSLLLPKAGSILRKAVTSTITMQLTSVKMKKWR